MVIILGKNGAGKTYIANILYDLGYNRLPSYTTREMRPGEINGIDYHFISNHEFEKLIDESFFIEYKKRANNYYGISLENANESSILVAGDLSKIQQFSTNIITIYINCSLEERFHRVSARNITPNELFQRFHLENFSFIDDFQAIYVENDNLDSEALNKIISLLSQKDFRYKSNRDFIATQVETFDFVDKRDMLSILRFEEYLIRKLALMLDLENDNNHGLFEQYYYTYIEGYLIQNNYNYHKKDNHLILELSNGKFNLDFKKEKIRKLRK